MNAHVATIVVTTVHVCACVCVGGWVWGGSVCGWVSVRMCVYMSM